MMNCKICGSKNYKIFDAQILKMYSVSYHKCKNCEFIQTDEPYWLQQAYSSAITNQDIGLINRNIFFSPLVEIIIYCFYDVNGKFLDYGGGYGLFVRIMRDRGLNFKRYDTYCENIFAKNFDYVKGEKYELITSFEVFEHLVDPLTEIESMLKISNSILFTTEIQPKDFVDLNKWWYVMPETGQHISLYSIKTLHFIAQKYNLNFYTNGSSFHLLTNKKINSVYFKLLTNKYISNIMSIFIRKRPSLLWKDYLELTKI